MGRRVMRLVLLLAALAVACGDGAAPGFDGGPCVGHVERRCACPMGAVGLEVCGRDGGVFCACP